MPFGWGGDAEFRKPQCQATVGDGGIGRFWKTRTECKRVLTATRPQPLHSVLSRSFLPPPASPGDGNQRRSVQPLPQNGPNASPPPTSARPCCQPAIALRETALPPSPHHRYHRENRVESPPRKSSHPAPYWPHPAPRPWPPPSLPAAAPPVQSFVLSWRSQSMARKMEFASGCWNMYSRSKWYWAAQVSANGPSPNERWL